MEESRNKIYAVLIADAQTTASGKLGNLIGKSAVAPYGIYGSFSLSETTASYMVFKSGIATQNNRFSSDNIVMEEIFEFSVFGNNCDAIQDRIFQLFDRQVLTGLTNDRILKCHRDWISADMFDENLRVLRKDSRYIFQTYRKNRKS